MHIAELIRWAAVAALAAAALRFPLNGSWSIGPCQPLVLASVRSGGLRRFRFAIA